MPKWDKSNASPDCVRPESDCGTCASISDGTTALLCGSPCRPSSKVYWWSPNETHRPVGHLARHVSTHPPLQETEIDRIRAPSERTGTAHRCDRAQERNCAQPSR